MDDRIDAAILTLLVVTVITLLPMIPAIGIYKVAPTGQMTADGKFAGLTINAGGAIAAYLVIFSALTLLAKPIIGSIIESGLLWTVYGDLNLVDGDGKPISAPELASAITTRLSIETDPKTYGGIGKSFHFAVARDNGRFPDVGLKAEDRGSASLQLSSLGPDEATVNDWTRVVILKNPITMSIINSAAPYTSKEVMQSTTTDINALPPPSAPTQ